MTGASLLFLSISAAVSLYILYLYCFTLLSFIVSWLQPITPVLYYIYILSICRTYSQSFIPT